TTFVPSQASPDIFQIPAPRFLFFRTVSLATLGGLGLFRDPSNRISASCPPAFSNDHPQGLGAPTSAMSFTTRFANWRVAELLRRATSCGLYRRIRCFPMSAGVLRRATHPPPLVACSKR